MRKATIFNLKKWKTSASLLPKLQKFQPKSSWRKKKQFFNLFFSLVFFSNLRKPNQWWIHYYHESNFNHLSDAPGAFNISMQDIDVQSCGAPLEWNLLFISMIGKSSQNSFFKFSIYMIGEKKKVRLRSLSRDFSPPKWKDES